MPPPNDNEQKTPTIVIIAPNCIVAFFRDHPFWSIKYAVTTSKIEIADVSAAINNKMKNSVTQMAHTANWQKNEGYINYKYKKIG